MNSSINIFDRCNKQALIINIKLFSKAFIVAFSNQPLWTEGSVLVRFQVIYEMLYHMPFLPYWIVMRKRLVLPVLQTLHD